MRLLLCLILIVVSTKSFAQNKLFLCAEYNKDGTYSGTYSNWSIEKTGNYVYLFFESATPVSDTVMVKIDRIYNRRDTSYYEFDHYYLVPEESKKFAVNKYTFTKPGNYRINVYDRNGVRLAEPHFTEIKFAENEYDQLLFKDSWYYNTSKIYFYEKMIGDSMVGKTSIFNLKQNETTAILYIEQENQKPLKSGHLFVSVYSDDSCHELVSAYTYYINENWFWTFIPVSFKRKGKFIVELYNDNDVFIQREKIEIR